MHGKIDDCIIHAVRNELKEDIKFIVGKVV